MIDESFLQAKDEETLRHFMYTFEGFLTLHDLQFRSQSEQFIISNFILSL